MKPIDAVCAALADLPLERDVPMRALTTFGLGGPADLLLRARSEQDVLRASAAAEKIGFPLYMMGNGSNLLVRDGGIRGLVVVASSRMASFSINGTTIRADAGISLTALSREALKANLMGLEWACGIPGTLGGACAMNAGAYGGSMHLVLKRVRFIENGEIQECDVRPGDMDYRESVYCAPVRVVLGATLALSPDDGGAAERQADYMRRRQEKQPLQDKSAGSTFKRPPGCFTGVLIEGIGMKGARIGGALVSPRHAGFIVNDGTATAADVLRLIETVQERVYDAYGVHLRCEIKIWGDDPL